MTGASRGIGAAIAVALARDGHDFIVNYTKNEAAAEAVRAKAEGLGRRAVVARFDVTDHTATRAKIAELLAEGPIDILVNNAGVIADAPFPSLSPEGWDSVVRTSLDGFYNVTQPLVMPMVRKRWGRIISISSISGVMGNRGQVNYSAAKVGLIGATKSLAQELAKRHITVNAVAPGLIETDMIEGAPIEEILKQVPMRRLGKAEEVDWDRITHLATRLGAPARSELVANLPRKASRTMGRVSLLATAATQQALDDAGISREEVRFGAVGLAYGSTHGSSSANEEWATKLITNQNFLGLASTAYLKFMSHTAATNLAVHFGFRGRIITTCAACVSASQAIGYAYENIKHGLTDVMVAGGAEELHLSHAGVFDIMYATSRAFNDTPELGPRPFDERHDGLVVGEGAGTFVLEEWERAKTTCAVRRVTRSSPA